MLNLPYLLLRHRRELTDDQLGFFVRLAEYRNAETGYCCPSQQRLADEAHKDVKTVRRYLEHGRNIGLYKIVRLFNRDGLPYHAYEWDPDLFFTSLGAETPNEEPHDSIARCEDTHEPYLSTSVDTKTKDKDRDRVHGFIGAETPNDEIKPKRRFSALVAEYRPRNSSEMSYFVDEACEGS